MITIYTDGSARNNPGRGGWGAIVVLENYVVELGGRESLTTNNIMELTAPAKALQYLVDAGTTALPVTVYTDSQYVKKGISEWIHGWIKNGWQTSAKKPVLNRELWQSLYTLTKQFSQLQFEYVPGHAGVDANERCDVIATSFADTISIDLYNGDIASYGLSLDKILNPAKGV